MHISEGILTAPVLAAGAVAAAAGTAAGLRRLDGEHIAQAGILAAAFFVSSLIHVPVGPASAHLILNGVVGLLLGWAAFPVILVALLLQAVFFQFGGLTTLGVNTCIMALPAVTLAGLGRRWLLAAGVRADVAAFFCGAGAIAGAGLLAAASLVASRQDFLHAAAVLLAAHIPVMIIEGIVTVFCVRFVKKVQPDLLSAGWTPTRETREKEAS